MTSTWNRTEVSHLPQQEFVERQAAIFHLPGNILADVADVPRLGHVAGYVLFAIGVADDEAVLIRVLGKPGCLWRAGEAFELAATEAHVSCGSELVLAVAW